jgi:hypothetical protein
MLSTVLLAGRGRLDLQTLILTHLKRRRGKLSLTWLNRLDFHGSIVGVNVSGHAVLLTKTVDGGHSCNADCRGTRILANAPVKPAAFSLLWEHSVSRGAVPG